MYNEHNPLVVSHFSPCNEGAILMDEDYKIPESIDMNQTLPFEACKQLAASFDCSASDSTCCSPRDSCLISDSRDISRSLFRVNCKLFYNWSMAQPTVFKSDMHKDAFQSCVCSLCLYGLLFPSTTSPDRRFIFCQDCATVLKTSPVSCDILFRRRLHA